MCDQAAPRLRPRALAAGGGTLPTPVPEPSAIEQATSSRCCGKAVWTQCVLGLPRRRTRSLRRWRRQRALSATAPPPPSSLTQHTRVCSRAPPPRDFFCATSESGVAPLPLRQAPRAASLHSCSCEQALCRTGRGWWRRARRRGRGAPPRGCRCDLGESRRGFDLVGRVSAKISESRSASTRRRSSAGRPSRLISPISAALAYLG